MWPRTESPSGERLVEVAPAHEPDLRIKIATNVQPIEFAIYLKVGTAVYASVYASDYTDADKARYAAAFDAIIPEAIRQAGVVRATTQRPRR